MRPCLGCSSSRTHPLELAPDEPDSDDDDALSEFDSEGARRHRQEMARRATADNHGGGGDGGGGGGVRVSDGGGGGGGSGSGGGGWGAAMARHVTDGAAADELRSRALSDDGDDDSSLSPQSSGSNGNVDGKNSNARASTSAQAQTQAPPELDVYGFRLKLDAEAARARERCKATAEKRSGRWDAYRRAGDTAGGVLTTSSRPPVSIPLLLHAGDTENRYLAAVDHPLLLGASMSVERSPSKLIHARSEFECLFSMTLPHGGTRRHAPPHRGPQNPHPQRHSPGPAPQGRAWLTLLATL